MTIASLLEDPLTQLHDVLTLAKRKGAEQAEAVMIKSRELTASVRKGKAEGLERSESAGLGVRVLIGKRQAMVSTSDFAVHAVDELVERAVAMARLAPEDPYLRLATPGEYTKNNRDLDLHDPNEPSAEALLKLATACEEKALAVPGITNSEGADGSYGTRQRWHATSEGFNGFYPGSSWSLSVSVIAGEGSDMQRDYDYSVARHSGDLSTPEAIGAEAARRTLARLHPRKLPTCELPVMFDPRVSRQLLGNFASAINGASVARHTSFLQHKMGERLFPASIHIIDNPHRRRGLASHPFDGEGIEGDALTIVDAGVLKHWFLDIGTAMQLQMKTTGHAARGLSSAPSPAPSNLYLSAGQDTPQAMIGEIKQGLYVTETFGMGVNLVTGDYSQGAAGFLIENGAITYPVSEITIAGHLLEMFASLEAADDLHFHYATNAPTLKVARMTVAGA